MDIEELALPTVSTAGPSAEPPKPKHPIGQLGDFFRGTQAFLPLAVIGLFMMAVVYFFYFARPFLMPVILAVILNFLLKPLVRGLARLRIPEALGSAIVIVAFLLTLWFIISRLSVPAAQWMQRAPETLRSTSERIRHLLRPAAQLTQVAAQVEDLAKNNARETPMVEVKQSHLMGGVLSFTRSFVAGGIETIVLLYFLLAAGDLFMHKLVRVLPTLHDKKRAVEIAHELQRTTSAFLFTITVINVLLGLAVGVFLKLIGMPNPVLWGVVAGVLNYVPYLGPITGVGVLFLAGLTTFDSVGRAMLAPAIYLALHAIESNIITPMVIGRRLTLNPVVIFISIIFWTWLWGIPGALLSVPMLMMIKIFCDHFQPLAAISEFLSG